MPSTRKKVSAQYGQTVWQRNNGLPSNAVNVVLQTREGYVWLGTPAGLFRFDGVSFTKVNLNKESAASYEGVSSLAEASDSSLWIGTAYDGLRHWKDGVIRKYGKNEGFFNTQIKELLVTRSKQLLIGTSIGVYLFDHSKFIQLFTNPNFITALTEDSTRNIWIGTHSGVYVVSSNTHKTIFHLSTQTGLPSDNIQTIYIDRHANVWIGSANGLSRWKNKALKNFSTGDGMTNAHVNTIYQDKDDNLWVGTQGGLCRYSHGRWSKFQASDGLTDDNVLAITEDHEASIWVSTSDGLNQFKNTNVTTFTTYDGLANDYISSIVEAPDRTMYYLSVPGANVTQIKNGRIKKYNISVGPAHIAKDGSLWIGQNGYLFNIKNNVLKQYDTSSGLPPKWISAITEDEQGLLMYVDHTGIFRFGNGRLRPFTISSGQQFAKDEYVVCFYPQRKDLLWIGTADYLVKVENGKMTKLHGERWISRQLGQFNLR